MNKIKNLEYAGNAINITKQCNFLVSINTDSSSPYQSLIYKIPIIKIIIGVFAVEDNAIANQQTLLQLPNPVINSGCCGVGVTNTPNVSVNVRAYDKNIISSHSQAINISNARYLFCCFYGEVMLE